MRRYAGVICLVAERAIFFGYIVYINTIHILGKLKGMDMSETNGRSGGKERDDDGKFL